MVMKVQFRRSRFSLWLKCFGVHDFWLLAQTRLKGGSGSFDGIAHEKFPWCLTRNPRQHVHAKTGVEGGRAKVPENAKFGANDPIEALSFRGGRWEYIIEIVQKKRSIPTPNATLVAWHLRCPGPEPAARARRRATTSIPSDFLFFICNFIFLMYEQRYLFFNIFHTFISLWIKGGARKRARFRRRKWHGFALL